MGEAELEADLIRLLGGGPINAMALTEEQRHAGYRLLKRGEVRKFWHSPGHALLGVYHFALAEPQPDLPQPVRTID